MASPSHYKHKAERYANKATEIQNYQNEVEFRRQLLSNIRQARIARAMLEVGNYNYSANISTQQGAIANIESSLAGEEAFAYGSSVRQQQMTDYVNRAQHYYKKYQKAQKKRAGVFQTVGQVVGAVIGAFTGGAGYALVQGALAGATIGGGIGQIASGTGQTQQGVQNILNGVGTAVDAYGANKRYEEQKELYESLLNDRTKVTQPQGYGNYVAASVIGGTPRYDTAETFLLPQLNGTTVKAVKGCY